MCVESTNPALYLNMWDYFNISDFSGKKRDGKSHVYVQLTSQFIRKLFDVMLAIKFGNYAVFPASQFFVQVCIFKLTVWN